jgi:phosphoribosyl 1,2-cyclic phosphodiesterase
LELGANAFLLKPLDKDRFLNQVERICKDHIELTFWGVRGTLPVPGPSTLRYGGNTSCISMEFAKGYFLIFDAGTGIKTLSDHLVTQQRGRIDAKIFITHPHWDHINALPFFAPLYTQGNTFEIFGASHGEVGMEQLVSAQMDGVFSPITIHEFGASIRYRNLREECLEMDNIRIRTMLLNHPGTCLGYRVEYGGRTICYITDNEIYPQACEFHNKQYVNRLTRFVAKADVMIIDSTYTDEEYKAKMHWGHSPVSEAVMLAHNAGVKTMCLFHHDPDQSDDDIDAKLSTARCMLERLGSETRCVAPAEQQLVEI